MSLDHGLNQVSMSSGKDEFSPFIILFDYPELGEVEESLNISVSAHKIWFS